MYKITEIFCEIDDFYKKFEEWIKVKQIEYNEVKRFRKSCV